MHIHNILYMRVSQSQCMQDLCHGFQSKKTPMHKYKTFGRESEEPTRMRPEEQI